MVPIVLDNFYVRNLLDNPKLIAEFTGIKDLSRQLRNKTSTCKTCNAASEIQGILDRARDYILSLPPDKFTQFKAVLGIPDSRQLMAYRILGNRNVPITR